MAEGHLKAGHNSGRSEEQISAFAAAAAAVHAETCGAAATKAIEQTVVALEATERELRELRKQQTQPSVQTIGIVDSDGAFNSLQVAQSELQERRELQPQPSARGHGVVSVEGQAEIMLGIQVRNRVALFVEEQPDEVSRLLVSDTASAVLVELDDSAFAERVGLVVQALERARYESAEAVAQGHDSGAVEADHAAAEAVVQQMEWAAAGALQGAATKRLGKSKFKLSSLDNPFTLLDAERTAASQRQQGGEQKSGRSTCRPQSVAGSRDPSKDGGGGSSAGDARGAAPASSRALASTRSTQAGGSAGAALGSGTSRSKTTEIQVDHRPAACRRFFGALRVLRADRRCTSALRSTARLHILRGAMRRLTEAARARRQLQQRMARCSLSLALRRLAAACRPWSRRRGRKAAEFLEYLPAGVRSPWGLPAESSYVLLRVVPTAWEDWVDNSRVVGLCPTQPNSLSPAEDWEFLKGDRWMAFYRQALRLCRMQLLLGQHLDGALLQTTMWKDVAFHSAAAYGSLSCLPVALPFSSSDFKSAECYVVALAASPSTMPGGAAPFVDPILNEERRLVTAAGARQLHRTVALLHAGAHAAAMLGRAALHTEGHESAAACKLQGAWRRRLWRARGRGSSQVDPSLTVAPSVATASAADTAELLDELCYLVAADGTDVTVQETYRRLSGRAAWAGVSMGQFKALLRTAKDKLELTNTRVTQLRDWILEGGSDVPSVASYRRVVCLEAWADVTFKQYKKLLQLARRKLKLPVWPRSQPEAPAPSSLTSASELKDPPSDGGGGMGSLRDYLAQPFLPRKQGGQGSKLTAYRAESFLFGYDEVLHPEDFEKDAGAEAQQAGLTDTECVSSDWDSEEEFEEHFEGTLAMQERLAAEELQREAEALAAQISAAEELLRSTAGSACALATVMITCSLVEGTATAEDVAQRKLYNPNAFDWRADLQVSAIKDNTRRVQRASAASRPMQLLLGQHLAAVRQDGSVVEAASISPLHTPPPQKASHFTPCLFSNLAYRLQDGERADLRRINGGLLDLGASISVVDAKSAAAMSADSSSSIIKYKAAKAVPARVVGGGCVMAVGECTIEFQLQCEETGRWHSFEETFMMIDGARTFILGNTFSSRYGVKADLESEMASLLLKDGRRFSTALSCYSMRAAAAMSVTCDPLVYTTEQTTIAPYSWAVVELQVPAEFEGKTLHISRLMESKAYANEVGLMVGEAPHLIGPGGRFLSCVYNSGCRTRQLPNMTAAARYIIGTEIVSCAPSDEQIQAIVDALNIPGVDEADLKKRREEVKDIVITQLRARYFDKERLGRSSCGEFHVETPTVDSGEESPANIPSRPLNKEQLEAARAEFQKMLDQGVLVPSTSPWGAPIVMVRKPNGRGWRLCLDYRAGNALAVKQHYPLPKVKDTLAKLKKARYFASLDCLKAFWQIPNSKTTQPKTAINFPWGKYEMTSMPMGMQAASATFQRTMDVLLRDLEFCVGFVDDVLVFSETWEEHLLHVAAVLDRIGGAGFTFDPAKCEIGKSETKFLGHLVSAEGTRPDPAKISTLKDATFPETKKELHHWVSLANYYASHVRDFALKTAVLQDYIHTRPVKGAGGKWVHLPPSEEVTSAFYAVRDLLCGDLLLVRPDFEKPFNLTLDAAKKVGGCGVVLSQLGDDGIDRPVSFWSVRWIDSTANWAPVEHECYAFRRGVEQYHEYLAHLPFVAFTDSEPLLWLQSLRKPRGRMAEWILELQSLDYTIQHKKGVDNINSDALSRLALKMLGTREDRRNIALNMRSPFESETPEVAFVAKEHSCCRWLGRVVSCVLTDGDKVLTLASFAGTGVLPTVAKLSAREPLRRAAIRGLAAQFHLSAAVSDLLDSTLGKPSIIKGDRVVYAVFSRCTQEWWCQFAGFTTHSAFAWATSAEIAATAHSADDRCAGRRLLTARSEAEGTGGVAHDALRRVFQSNAVAVGTVLPDGRAIPQSLLDNARDAWMALDLLSTHLSPLVGTDECFMVVDLEFEPKLFGVDLVQVAAGPYIFVFDTYCFSDVLTQRVLYHPAREGEERGAVPTLRHWLECKGVCVVMQALSNDAAKLRQYGITVANPFDTCVADAILAGLKDGRSLLDLANSYLSSHCMVEKEDFAHRYTRFRKRPLPQLEFDYAWQDVADGPSLYRAMRGSLTPLQFVVVKEQSTRCAETVPSVDRVVLMVFDSQACLLFDGSPFQIEMSGPLGHSTEARQFRVEARDALRKKAKALWEHDATMSLLLQGKWGDAVIVGRSLAFFKKVNELPNGVGSQLLSEAAFEGEPLSRLARHALWQLRPLADRPSRKLLIEDEDEVVDVLSQPNDAVVVEGEADEAAYDAVLAAWSAKVESFLQLSALPRYFPATERRVSAAAAIPTSFTYCPQESELEDIHSLTHVIVVVEDDAGCTLLLKRNPSSAIARADSSSAALPSLRTTEELYGKYRAQHAVNMLFGPLRAFDETAPLYESLSLRATVKVAGARNECYGVYVCHTERLEQLPLEEVFGYRRCTPTHAALYPGFSVSGVEGWSQLSELDSFVLDKLHHAPGLSAVHLPNPAVPLHERQTDATEGDSAPLRRARELGPGEQPTGSEVCDDLQAEFEEGRALPSVGDPLAFLQEALQSDLQACSTELADAQKDDADCLLIREWSANGFPPSASKRNRPLRRLFVKGGRFEDVDGVLHFVDTSGAFASRGEPHLRVVVPLACRESLVLACHDGLGHPGVKRTLRAVAARGWWPRMKSTVEALIAKCPTCLFNKTTVYRGTQHIPENGTRPWECIEIDIVHLQKTRSGKEKALVFYCRFTRGVMAFAVHPDCSTETVLNLLFFELVLKKGWPRVIYTDRGSNLISHKAQLFYESLGVELRAADAHMHTAVGGCERFNATLREMARASHFDHGFEWDLMLPLIIFWYEQLVQTATGYSPFYLNHGYDATLPWDIKNGPRVIDPSPDAYVQGQFTALRIAWQCALASLAEQEVAQKRAHDAKYQTNVAFKAGDRVLIRQAGRQTKMHMPYVGPYKIEEVLERDRYRVSGRRNARRDHHEFHISRLKFWPSGADNDDVYLGEDYYDVDFIVDHKLGRDGIVLYRVRWVGYGAKDDSWLPFTDMNAACARAALEYIKDRDEAGEDAADAGSDDEHAEDADASEAEAEPSEAPTAAAPAPAQPTQSDEREARLAARQARMGQTEDAAAGAQKNMLKELA